MRSDRMKSRVLRFMVDMRYPMRYRRLKKYLGREPRSVLEIGCGDGRFLIFLERKLNARCRLVGLDMEVSDIELGYGSRVELVRGSIGDMTPGRKFDAVVMYDVVEHLARPVAALKKIRSCLEQDGVLVIKTPNWNSLWRFVFPRHWGGLQIPRHQLFPDPASLGKLCGMAGFRVKRIANVFDPGDFSVSICNWITDSLSLRTLPRKAWFYLPMALVGAPIVLCQKWLLGQSGEIECACTLEESES